MNLGGLPHPLLPLPGGDPRDQLTSVGQTISKLTVNLAKLASPAKASPVKVARSPAPAADMFQKFAANIAKG